MLKSSSCDYIDADIPAKGTTTIPNTSAQDANASNANKKVITKNCAPCPDCISEINNAQIDNAKGTDMIMLYFNRI